MRPIHDLIPASKYKNNSKVTEWSAGLHGKSVVVVCLRGGKVSHGVAALLRHEGVDAISLEDGFASWNRAGFALVPTTKLLP